MQDLKIYRFGKTTDGDASMKDVLGGKGANLAEMAKLGIPVPPGYTIPTHASVQYLNGSDEYREGFLAGVMERIQEGEKFLRDQFGFLPLVSVRSGARVSMPGMMDTILDVGINDSNLAEWEERLGRKTALDSYRRFLQMYGATALGIPAEAFISALEDLKKTAKVEKDSDLSEDYLARLVKRYKDIYAVKSKTVPKTRDEALRGAIEAVFVSWTNERAVSYRKVENIPEDWGTAVTVQAMVFGNADDQSCSGVAFSRCKATGEGVATGDFIVNAQGEDVVAAGAPTLPLVKMAEWNNKVYHELLDVMDKLEKHYRDMQDVEFTVQYGKLWMLQTRNGKRSAKAAFRIAHDLVAEGLVDKATAKKRVKRSDLLVLMSPQIDPAFKGKPVAKGLGVGGNVVSGKACFTSASAIKVKESGGKAILVTKETDPDDFDGIMASVGILTATGGTTSHAAVVANGYNKTCVVGCKDLEAHLTWASLKGSKVKEGDILSIDGATGNIWLGEVPVIEPEVTDVMRAVCGWFADGDKAYRLTPEDPTELGYALQAVPKDVEVVHVDTCLMDMEVMLWSLAESILKCPAKTVVLDLSYVDAHYSGSDKCVNRMFGFDPMLGMGNKRASTLKEMKAEAAMKCVLKLPTSCTIGNTLRKKGFKVIGPVQTVADLLAADGAVVIDDETIAKVFGSKEALAFVQKALEASGKAPAKPLPEPAYWYEAFMKEGA